MKMKLAGIALKRPQNGTQTKVTHRRVEGSRFYVTYDRYIPIQTLIFTLLRNVICKIMFTAPKELGIPVVDLVLNPTLLSPISRPYILIFYHMRIIIMT